MAEPDCTGLDTWMADAAAQLGIWDIERADRTAVLDIARQVAHGVYRPAAPLTTYLMGLAVGRGARPADAAAIVAQLVADWQACVSRPEPVVGA